MKIIGNVGPMLKLATKTLSLNKYIRPLNKLKEKESYEEERALLVEAQRDWIDGLINAYGLKFEISGRENIPKEPCVFIANHQAYFDVMILEKALEGKQFGLIAKSEFEKVPVMSAWILRIRGLFINRGDARESLKTINEGVELIKKGFSLAIFPEGKRSCGEGMDEFKPGSFKLATKAKVPVVPITINGTYHFYEETGVFNPDAVASVVIHPPIETKDLDRNGQAELPDKVHEIIRNALPKKGEGYIKDWDAEQ